LTFFGAIRCGNVPDTASSPVPPPLSLHTEYCCLHSRYRIFSRDTRHSTPCLWPVGTYGANRKWIEIQQLSGTGLSRVRHLARTFGSCGHLEGRRKPPPNRDDLYDDLIRPQPQQHRDREAERLGGLEIDDECSILDGPSMGMSAGLAPFRSFQPERQHDAIRHLKSARHVGKAGLSSNCRYEQHADTLPT
jgi:hypothetical protein